MRQQHLSVEDPILAKGNSDTQNSYTESAKLTFNLQHLEDRTQAAVYAWREGLVQIPDDQKWASPTCLIRGS
jgi:hypothetical protein